MNPAGPRERGLLVGLILALAPGSAMQAQTLRIATWDPELSRSGPGILLRDIRKTAPQVAAAVQVIEGASPDILLLTGFDWDQGQRALAAFNAKLSEPYPCLFASRPNTGRPSGADLDDNGKINEPRDAQGYGRFTGQAGMALLSRLPIRTDEVRDFSDLLWRDLPGSRIGTAGLNASARAVQRLSTTAHWDVPLVLPEGTVLHLLAFAATVPVHDGPEDRNGLRNHDEAAFWLRYLDGTLPDTPPPPPFVLLGKANIDPEDGEGHPGALRALLADPRLQDPMPRSEGARMVADPDHRGDHARDTADYDGPGNLRLDYVLPSADLTLTGAGVLWPQPGAPLAKATQEASRHKLVWIDVAIP